MYHDQTELRPNEKAAVAMLVTAVQSHPNSGDAELAMVSVLLSKYINEPSTSTFSMARMAFDDIEPEIKKQICSSAISNAYSSVGTTKDQSSISILNGKSTPTPKDQRNINRASPYLAAINR